VKRVIPTLTDSSHGDQETLHRRHCKELGEILKNPRETKVVVMPDFFLDRLIILNWNIAAFAEKLQEVANHKGGCLDGIAQIDLKGGNAVNTASALTALDVKVTPIVCTNAFGLKLMKIHLANDNIDFSHVKIFDRPSTTTAIEVKTEQGRANIMLRDVGALADFGPQHLDDDDFQTIEEADFVCIFNWAGTRNFGTKLARAVFSHTKMRGKGRTYYDTADPTPNKQQIPNLIRDILESKQLDMLSVNENEAICYASHLNRKKETVEDLSVEERAKESARLLASRYSARIDLHATNFSVTFTGKKEKIVPAFRVPVLRATGAGDAWNAGNILGETYDLSDGARLTLANAVAAYYVSDPSGTHATREKLSKFLLKMSKKDPS